MKILNEYKFLIDDTQPEINPKNGVLFGKGDFLHNLFKNFERYGRGDVDVDYTNFVTEYDGSYKFIVQYNCYWHQDWYQGLQNINPKIINGLKEGKGKLVFMNHLEGQPLVSGDSHLNFLEPMYKELNRLEIPPQSIIYLTANAVADKYHNDWCVENNITDRMNILGIFTDAIIAQKEATTSRLNNRTFEQHLNILKTNTDVKHFIKVSRNDRHYKTIPTHHLWNKGLEDTMHTHVRLYARDDIGYPQTNDLNTKMWLQELLNTKSEFEKTLPYIIEKTCTENIKSFDSDREFTNKIYTLNLFNMYPSSWPLWKDTCFLRLGLFFHMWEYQPFLVFGNVGSLQNLKERGYETFPEIFDERYDKIEDNGKRLKMVCDELERISKLPLDECFKLYESVKDKLIYNRKQLEKNVELNRLLEFLNEAV